MNLLPAPVFNSPKSIARSVAPPLPPTAGLSIFDDSLGDTAEKGERPKEEDDDDDEEASAHPDDVLKGELLRTFDLISSGERSNSFYMVYSTRAKLVKIGITLYTYEECKAKYTKLYGNLESFHFLKIENDMTRERLERAFYQFFSETRMFSAKEFFREVDSHGRDMLPVYLALLTILTNHDLQAIRRFYLQHGTTGLAARLWVESQHEAFAQGTVELTPSEAQALNHVQILSSDAAFALTRANLNKPSTPAPTGFQGWDSGCESDDEPDEKEQDLAEGSDGSDGDSESEHNNPASKDPITPKATTAHLLAPPAAASSVSLFAAYSARAELVKIGFTTLAYEECAAKYKKVYGHLDEFYFLCVENDLLSHKETRIEKVFYRLFEQTRIHPGQEFFRPFDDRQRPMLPLYVSILRALAAEDTEPMRRFYRAHRHPEDMQDWIEQQLILYTPAPVRAANTSGKSGTPRRNRNLSVDSTNGSGKYDNISALGGPPLPKHVRTPTNHSGDYSTPSTPTTQSASPHSATYSTFGAQSTYSTYNSGSQGTYAAVPTNVSVKTSSKAGVSQPAAPVPFSLPLPQPNDGGRRDSEDIV